MDKIVSTAVTVDKAKDKFNNSYATAIERKERSNQHAEAEAADPHGMLPLKKKLRGLSYGANGQDPAKLFSSFDKDNSGELDFDEFVSAIRKGGKLTPQMISQRKLRTLFDAIDDDSSGDVSIQELTAFVWSDDKPAAPAGPKSDEEETIVVIFRATVTFPPCPFRLWPPT